VCIRDFLEISANKNSQGMIFGNFITSKQKEELSRKKLG
jgi:hypothetical protein